MKNIAQQEADFTGTSSGTSMLTDINPAGDFDPNGFYEFSNTLHFQGDDGTNGYERWKLSTAVTGVLSAAPESAWINVYPNPGNSIVSTDLADRKISLQLIYT